MQSTGLNNDYNPLTLRLTPSPYSIYVLPISDLKILTEDLGSQMGKLRAPR